MSHAPRHGFDYLFSDMHARLHMQDVLINKSNPLFSFVSRGLLNAKPSIMRKEVTPQELDAWLRSTDVDDAGGQQQEQQTTGGDASSSQSPTPPSPSAAAGENEVSLDYITAALHAGHDGSSSANNTSAVQGRGHYHQECSVSPLGVNDAPSPAPAPQGVEVHSRHVNRIDRVLSQMKPPPPLSFHFKRPSLSRHASVGSCRSIKTSASHDTVPVRNDLKRNRAVCHTPTEKSTTQRPSSVLKSPERASYVVTAASSCVNSPFDQKGKQDIMAYGRSASLPISFQNSDAIQEDEEEFDPQGGTLMHSHSMPTSSPHQMKPSTLDRRSSSFANEHDGSDYFLSAMKKSQRSQEHPVHSRRSMRFMMETQRSRGVLFQAMHYGIGRSRRSSSMSPSAASSVIQPNQQSPLLSNNKRCSPRSSEVKGSPAVDHQHSSRTKGMIEQDMKNIMLRTLEDEYLSKGKLDLPVHLPRGSVYASHSSHHHALGSGYYNAHTQQQQQSPQGQSTMTAKSDAAMNFNKKNKLDKESAIKAELQRITQEQMMEEMGVSARMSF